jgi:hypothetical protein
LERAVRSVKRGEPDGSIKSVSGRTLKLPDHLASGVDFPDYRVRSVGNESISVFQALRKTQERPEEGWVGVVLPNERRGHRVQVKLIFDSSTLRRLVADSVVEKEDVAIRELAHPVLK